MTYVFIIYNIALKYINLMYCLSINGGFIMKLYFTIAIVLFLVIGAIVMVKADKASNENNKIGDKAMRTSNFYDLSYISIDGEPVSMSAYKGKPIVIVNVASKCGFTGQYADLEKLYDDYKDKGLVVLGLPSNDFGGQEPGNSEDIKAFCSLTYGVSFPMSEKVKAKDPKHPIYEYLTDKKTNPEHAAAISWNFNKFIIDRQGNVVKHFSSMTNPSSDKFRAVIDSVI